MPNLDEVMYGNRSYLLTGWYQPCFNNATEQLYDNRIIAMRITPLLINFLQIRRFLSSSCVAFMLPMLIYNPLNCTSGHSHALHLKKILGFARSLMISLIITTVLSGCGCGYGYKNCPKKINIYYPTDAGSLNAHTKLTEAAVSATDSLTEIAAIEKATQPKAKINEPPNPDSIGLGGLASVDWTGPIEPLVQKLAAAGHYKYRVIGKRPAIPVLVAVYAYNMPIADILRDANFQAGKRANIYIYPRRRVIELRYDP